MGDVAGAILGRGCGALLSSAKIGTASWRYYTDAVACRPTECYLGVGEAPGHWHGRGLPQLGLISQGRVSEQQLEALFARGLHPTLGERLGRAWRADGVTGYDLTFSAPKSVSALWALGSAEVAGAVLQAHQLAVTVGLAYLDGHASSSRRGTDGVEQVASAGLVAALFDHRTSRAGDPQLHTHALVLNKVRCADGVWRTVDGTEVFAHKKTAGMIYQNALRNELHARLGVDFEPVSRDGQAEVRGLPAALLTMWSKRTAAITVEAAPRIAEYESLLGRTLTVTERTAVTKTAVLKTRPGKTHPEITSLHATWTAEATTLGWTPARLQQATSVTAPRTALPAVVPATASHVATPETGAERPTTGLAPDPALSAGVPWLLEALQAAGRRSAVFSRTDVAGQVAAHLPTSGLTASQVLERVEELTDAALGLSEAVPVGQPVRGVTPRTSDARYATVEVLQAEARILSLTGRGRAGGYGQTRPEHVAAALTPADVTSAVPSRTPATLTARGDETGDVRGDDDARGHGTGNGAGEAGGRSRLDAGQLRALIHLTTDDDFLSVLVAPAGAGKTSTLGVTSRAWTAAGYRVVGLAPSARAAAELTGATGSLADTLAKWLHDQDHPVELPDAERAWAAVDDRTVLLVDEASMASTLDLDRLTGLAARVAAKVVLIGDPSQIGVINGPGGMLAALSHAGHAVELQQIHRFTHSWERDASQQLRRGNPAVLMAYQRQGRLHPCPDSDTALDELFTHWTQARAAGQDAMMLARTRVDVDALNTRARTAALTTGQVHGPVVTAGDRQWQTGDLLRTRRNNRTLTVGASHVRNGDRYRVLSPDPTVPGGLVVEDLTGRGRLTLPAPYLTEHCEYGWASTIDAAQGATVDVGLVLVRPGLDREHLYVALTRGRHSNHAYTTPDPTVDPNHDHDHQHQHQHQHQQPPDRATDRPAGCLAPAAGTDQADRQALKLLEAALAHSGAQDAARTALAIARQVAPDESRKQQAHRHPEGAAPSRSEQGDTAGLPPAHTHALSVLDNLQQQQTALARTQGELDARIGAHERDLRAAPPWFRGRRRSLSAALHDDQTELQSTQQEQQHLQQQIDQTTALVDTHARQRRDDQPMRAPGGRHNTADVAGPSADPARCPGGEPDLARPRPPRPAMPIPPAVPRGSSRAPSTAPWSPVQRSPYEPVLRPSGPDRTGRGR